MACLDRGMARVDARLVRLHHLRVHHAADRAGVRRPADRGDGGVHADTCGCAWSGATGVGLARRSHRSQDAADDLDRLVLAVQFHRRLLAKFRVPVLLPRAARHRHGCGVAGRRLARAGAVADPLARLHGGRDAGIVGPGRPAVGRRLRAAATTTSAGAACCGSACCRRWRSSMCGSSWTNRRSGSRTDDFSARRSAKCACR